MFRNAQLNSLLDLVNFKINNYALLSYLLASVLLLIVASQQYVPVEYLTRDSTAVSGGRFYAGLVSNVGLFIWCSAAAITLFAFVLIKSGDRLEKRFLVCSAGITFMLLLDDFLLLHELVFPHILGISENFFFLLYPLSIITFTIYFSQILIRTQVLIYLSALSFLAISMLLDKVLTTSGDLAYLLEDGCKFIGIVGWCTYFVQTSMHIVKRNRVEMPVINLVEVPVISMAQVNHATADSKMIMPN